MSTQAARVGRYADLAGRVLDTPPRLGTVRLVAIDGPAGSGKSSFADRLARALAVNGLHVEIVHTDDLLAGWTDLVSFWPRLEDGVLSPLRSGHAGHYRRYDWVKQRFAEEREVPVPDVLIVEGVTSARAEVAAELSLSVFLTAEPDLRLRRGLERDGSALMPHWQRWMSDEQRHFAADRTPLRADVTVDGAPTLGHDPESEYVLAD